MNETLTPIGNIEGSTLEQPFFQITFQKGSVNEVGVNGCRIEDVIDALTQKLGEYQSGPLGCIENEEALRHLAFAKSALLLRRTLREEQGVINTFAPHESMFEERTEDEDHDFSATGA